MRKKSFTIFLVVVGLMLSSPAWALKCNINNQTSVTWLVGFHSRMGHGSVLEVLPNSSKEKSTSFGVSIRDVQVIRADPSQPCPDCPEAGKCEFIPPEPVKGQYIVVEIGQREVVIKMTDKKGNELEILKSCK